MQNNDLLSFISRMYQVAITPLDSPSSVEAFCSANRLHTVQAFFQSERLGQFIQGLEEGKVWHITGVLQIHALLLRLDGSILCIGPFCPLIMTTADCSSLLSKQKIQNITPEELRYYRDRFPVISEREAEKIALTLLWTLNPQDGEAEVITFSSDEEESEEEEVYTRYEEIVEEHYATERSFMEAIARGDKSEALRLLSIQQLAFQSFKRLGTTLENERIGSAIVRTMIRCAASSAGMSAMENDLLSRHNTMATRRADSVDEIIRAKERMVAEYADAMRLHRISNHSNLSFKVMIYLENNYQKEISITALSEEFGYTPQYLTTLLRTETGMTPTEYLRKVRTSNAASLLCETRLDIATISQRVGISDSNYFVKLFRKDYGVTPSEYRRRNHL